MKPLKREDNHQTNSSVRAVPPKSTSDWIAWGQVDPLYGVATVSGRSRFDATPWTDDEFYALGADWECFHDCWRRYGLTTDKCVEVGCGAGRLTGRIAGDLGLVIGLDVSSAQIEYARRRMPANVALLVTDGVGIPLADGSVSAVFSAHVFQHLESRELAVIVFREVYRVLNSGGSMMVHLPITIWPTGLLSGLHRRMEAVRERIGDARSRMHRFIFKHGLRRFPLARWTTYEADWLHSVLSDVGFTELQCSMLFVRTGMFGFNGRHCFVLARKA